MPSSLLYALTVLIWGSTWFAIHFQLGVVPVEWSVAYRFALAATALGLWCVWQRRALRVALHQHRYLIAIGSLLESLNYVLIYIGSNYLATGVIATVFALITVANTINGRVFLGIPITFPIVMGAFIGVCGVALLFWPEIRNFSLADQGVLGMALALGSVFLASLGNTIAAAAQRSGLSAFQLNFWGMVYGTILTTSYAAALGGPLAFDWSWSYIVTLGYLSLFGSVIAFNAYFILIQRIGLSQAAYVGVLMPIIALLLSTLFEDYRWTLVGFAGVTLCLAGNVIILRRRKAKA